MENYLKMIEELSMPYTTIYMVWKNFLKANLKIFHK